MVGKRALVASSVIVMLMLAGCAGKDASKPDADEAADQDLPEDPFVNPGFVSKTGGFVEGESVSFYCDEAANSTVNIDQNRTFSGSFHSHDMWQGEDAKVIFDAHVDRFVSGNWFETPGAVVFPGAGRAEFMLDWDPVDGNDWRQLGVDLPALKINTTDVYVDHVLNFTKPREVHTIDFSFKQDDRPHAERTTWNFKMTPYNAATLLVPEAARTVAGIPIGLASSTAGLQQATLVWTIFRTYDCLPVDPPHYELWNGTTEKLIVDATTTHAYTSTPGTTQGFLYSFPEDIINTVPPGTGTVVVDMTWHAQEPWPMKLGLEYLGADGDAGSTSAVWKAPPPNTDEATHRVYILDVHPLEADSPYANKTAWDFRIYFDALGHDAVDDVGRFTGTVDWVITAYRVGFGPSP